jgi:Transglutaminase-like superfamily
MLRVYLLLIATRGIITALSLRRITARLGTAMEETPTDGLAADQVRYARRVGRAISRAAPRTPTNSNCYPQALTAWWLLHRRQIPTTFYYGAAFDEDGTALQAHAWLRCGPVIVTGGGGQRRRFAPLTWYADTQVADGRR